MFAALRGFSIDNDDLKRIMARIAADSPKGWANSFRAMKQFAHLSRHREIAYRKLENKEAGKLRAEI